MARKPSQLRGDGKGKAKKAKPSPSVIVKDRSEQRANNVIGRPFQKGQSGNPGGRPKEVAEVRELARTYTTAAIRRLVEIMSDDNPRAAVAACNAILDRGWGKPTQFLGNDHERPLVPILNLTLGSVSGAN